MKILKKINQMVAFFVYLAILVFTISMIASFAPSSLGKKPLSELKSYQPLVFKPDGRLAHFTEQAKKDSIILSEETSKVFKLNGIKKQ